jgi:hypothetical protein
MIERVERNEGRGFSLLTLGCWYGEIEGGALIELALRPDIPPVGLNQMFYDRKAKACPA